MKLELDTATLRRQLLPTRALALLLGIGFLDLLVTAVLHANGLVVEMNPLMRPLIERSEWLFVAVKSLTLLLAWGVMAWYARQNLDFVRKTCFFGAGFYALIWCLWFFAAA